MIIFLLVFHKKTLRCGFSLESPFRGNSDEYPFCRFLWRNKQNYKFVVIKYSAYLVFWAWLRQTEAGPCIGGRTGHLC